VLRICLYNAIGLIVYLWIDLFERILLRERTASVAATLSRTGNYAMWRDSSEDAPRMASGVE
jgi:hypothetical protein